MSDDTEPLRKAFYYDPNDDLYFLYSRPFDSKFSYQTTMNFERVDNPATIAAMLNRGRVILEALACGTQINEELLGRPFLESFNDVLTVGETVLASTQRVAPQSDDHKVDSLQPIDSLPKNMYEIYSDMKRFGVRPYKFSCDKYVDLRSDIANDIIEEIETFLSSRDRYHDMGFLHKRGMLLYGPPGTGKTLLVEHITKKYLDRARVLFVQSMMGLDMLKPYFADIPTIIVFEEFTECGNGQSMLSFLDGEESWDGCLVIATTNYPERLPDNIIDRPARFDKIIEMGAPDADTRRVYLESKLDKKLVTNKLISMTEGFTIAYLKELAVSSRIFDKPLEVVLEEFAARKKKLKEFAQKNARGNPFALFSGSELQEDDGY